MEDKKGYKMQEQPKDKIWVAYLDDDDQAVRGFFTFVSETENYLCIKSGKEGSRPFRLPWHRVLKMKSD